ncbi:MAG: NAD(P)-dependent oxidoreductase [Dehalococcoidales bacterium]|nr:NAD(P)-dependent oxidoreductase [Dehalococcoidales bacterium]
MKILVTGGAGYIGSVLVPLLLGEGHEVIVLDNFRYNQTSLLDCCHDSRLTIVRGDARDRNLVAESLQKCDAAFPLACLAGAPECSKDPTQALDVNLNAVGMLLKLRSRNQIVIFPTSNSGYGIGQVNAEGKPVHCTEETPLNPVSLYGRLKVQAEKLVLESGNSITLRLATAFGISPRMRLDLLVNDFTYRAVTDRFLVLFESHFKRNYIHVRDVARAFIHCLNHFDAGQTYNVGLSDANLSKWELCQEIQKQVPDFWFTEAQVGEDPDKRNYIVSNEKIEKTGFKPEVSLQMGIAELIKGYQVIRRSQFSNV